MAQSWLWDSQIAIKKNMVFCQEDPNKGNAVDNYRSILYLTLMCKLMTGTITESIYNFLEVNDKLPVEQEGRRKKSRGTKDQSLTDKTILCDFKKTHKSGNDMD